MARPFLQAGVHKTIIDYIFRRGSGFI